MWKDMFPSGSGSGSSDEVADEATPMPLSLASQQLQNFSVAEDVVRVTASDNQDHDHHVNDTSATPHSEGSDSGTPIPNVLSARGRANSARLERRRSSARFRDPDTSRPIELETMARDTQQFLIDATEIEDTIKIDPDDAMNRLQRLKQHVVDDRKWLENRIEKMWNDYQSEIDRMRRILRAADVQIISIDSEQQDVEQHEHALQEEVERLENQLAMYTVRADTAETTVQNLEAVRDECEEKYNRQEADLRQSQNQVNELERELSTTRDFMRVALNEHWYMTFDMASRSLEIMQPDAPSNPGADGWSSTGISAETNTSSRSTRPEPMRLSDQLPRNDDSNQSSPWLGRFSANSTPDMGQSPEITYTNQFEDSTLRRTESPLIQSSLTAVTNSSGDGHERNRSQDVEPRSSEGIERGDVEGLGVLLPESQTDTRTQPDSEGSVRQPANIGSVPDGRRSDDGSTLPTDMVNATRSTRTPLQSDSSSGTDRRSQDMSASNDARRATPDTLQLIGPSRHASSYSLTDAEREVSGERSQTSELDFMVFGAVRDPASTGVNGSGLQQQQFSQIYELFTISATSSLHSDSTSPDESTVIGNEETRSDPDSADTAPSRGPQSSLEIATSNQSTTSNSQSASTDGGSGTRLIPNKSLPQDARSRIEFTPFSFAQGRTRPKPRSSSTLSQSSISSPGLSPRSIPSQRSNSPDVSTQTAQPEIIDSMQSDNAQNANIDEIVVVPQETMSSLDRSSDTGSNSVSIQERSRNNSLEPEQIALPSSCGSPANDSSSHSSVQRFLQELSNRTEPSHRSPSSRSSTSIRETIIERDLSGNRRDIRAAQSRTPNTAGTTASVNTMLDRAIHTLNDGGTIELTSRTRNDAALALDRARARLNEPMSPRQHSAPFRLERLVFDQILDDSVSRRVLSDHQWYRESTHHGRGQTSTSSVVQMQRGSDSTSRSSRANPLAQTNLSGATADHSPEPATVPLPESTAGGMSSDGTLADSNTELRDQDQRFGASRHSSSSSQRTASSQTSNHHLQDSGVAESRPSSRTTLPRKPWISLLGIEDYDEIFQRLGRRASHSLEQGSTSPSSTQDSYNRSSSVSTVDGAVVLRTKRLNSVARRELDEWGERHLFSANQMSRLLGPASTPDRDASTRGLSDFSYGSSSDSGRSRGRSQRVGPGGSQSLSVNDIHLRDGLDDQPLRQETPDLEDSATADDDNNPQTQLPEQQSLHDTTTTFKDNPTITFHTLLGQIFIYLQTILISAITTIRALLATTLTSTQSLHLTVSSKPHSILHNTTASLTWLLALLITTPLPELLDILITILSATLDNLRLKIRDHFFCVRTLAALVVVTGLAYWGLVAKNDDECRWFADNTSRVREEVMGWRERRWEVSGLAYARWWVMTAVERGGGEKVVLLT